MFINKYLERIVQDSNSRNNAMTSEMPTMLDVFDLELSLNEVASSDIVEIDATEWSALPPPQKFSARSSKSQDAVSNGISCKIAANYKRISRRSMGLMIALEEAADWSCTNENIQRSACRAADLMIKQEV